MAGRIAEMGVAGGDTEATVHRRTDSRRQTWTATFQDADRGHRSDVAVHLVKADDGQERGENAVVVAEEDVADAQMRRVVLSLEAGRRRLQKSWTLRWRTTGAAARPTLLQTMEHLLPMTQTAETLTWISEKKASNALACEMKLVV